MLYCSLQCRDDPQHHFVLDWLEQNHTLPQPRGPQITPELEMRNIASFQTACLSEEAEKPFASKAKLWSLWSVGHVVEEMLIMWLCSGLVCCDLEGSSHGALRFCETRGVTAGTAPGRKKMTQTLSNWAFSLIFWSCLYKHFPNVRGFQHVLVLFRRVSIWLALVWLRLNLSSSLLLPAHLHSAPSTAKPHNKITVRLLLCMLPESITKPKGGLCKLWHQGLSHIDSTHIHLFNPYVNSMQEPTHSSLLRHTCNHGLE